MKQEEKTRITRGKILQAAFSEFGEKGYEDASLTLMGQRYSISKGLFYHNFENKKAIYLECVRITYHDIMEYLKPLLDRQYDIRHGLDNLMERRKKFFSQNPEEARIFFSTILNPPKELEKEICLIRRDFLDFHRRYYQAILEKEVLREGVDIGTAVDYLEMNGEMFNAYFASHLKQGRSLEEQIVEHERMIRMNVEFILFGMLANNKRNEK